MSTSAQLVYLLLILSLNSIFAFKCKFTNYKFEDDISLYTCELTLDSQNQSEAHLTDKADNDVKSVVIDGILNLNQQEFPFCERFSNIERIKIFKANSIDGNLLQKCAELNLIRIKNGKIDKLPENLFDKNTKLTFAELVNNNLKELPENLFINLKNLTSLSISSNELIHLPSNIFKSLQNLIIMSLDGNGFKSLDPAWFENLKNLQILILNFNEISDLPRDVFKPLTNLHHLWLFGNELTVIHSDSFGTHPYLQNIDLKQNKINEIDQKLFDKAAVSNLDMEINNACFKGKITNKNDIQKKLKKCFQNYQPRMVSIAGILKSDASFDDKVRLIIEENDKLMEQVRNLQEALNQKNKNWLCKFA
ncbi:phospholipase A2 inhibitor beta-like [Chironomus tepperi]|uniref:phospholipase A2 inhibitor beta-like n=1 Tax=Chironomus tepperi TaxID=113505 RepID=UPI00391F4F3D